MDSKLIIFLVFASLAQCSFVECLSVDFGLPNDSLASFVEIDEYQKKADLIGMYGYDSIFVKIQKELAKSIYGLGEEVTGEESSIELESLQEAIYYTLDGFLVLVGGNCSDIEERRNALSPSATNVTGTMAAAFDLAASGDSPANRAQLEEYETQVKEHFASSVELSWASVSTCLASTDAGILAEIELGKKQSDLALRYTAYGIFNALKLMSVAITAEKADVSLLYAVEEYRSQVQNLLRYDLQNKFSVMKTIYLAKELGLTGSIDAVSDNQYTWTLSSFHYKAAMDGFFNTIVANYRVAELGLSLGGRANLSQAEGAKTTQVSRTMAAYGIFLDSVLTVRPEATAAVQAANEKLDTAVTDTVDSFYVAIEAAQAAKQNYSASVEKIESLREQGAVNVDNYVATFFDLLHNRTYDDAIETALETLKKDADEYFRAAMNSIFDVTVIIAQAYNAGEASGETLTAILTEEESARSSVEIFTEKVSAAGIIVIQAENNL